MKLSLLNRLIDARVKKCRFFFKIDSANYLRTEKNAHRNFLLIQEGDNEKKVRNMFGIRVVCGVSRLIILEIILN